MAAAERLPASSEALQATPPDYAQINDGVPE